MSRSIGEASVSPTFIKAVTEEELRLKLAENQVLMGGSLHYLSISHNGKEWVAWFMADLSDIIASETFKKIRGESDSKKRLRKGVL